MKAAIVCSRGGLRRLREREAQIQRGTRLALLQRYVAAVAAMEHEPAAVDPFGWALPGVMGAQGVGPLPPLGALAPAPPLGGGHAAWALPDIAWDPHLVVRDLPAPRGPRADVACATVCWAPSTGRAQNARRRSPARPLACPPAGGHRGHGAGRGRAAAAGACARAPGLAGPGPTALHPHPVRQRAQLAGRPVRRPAPGQARTSRPRHGAHVQGARLHGGVAGARRGCSRPQRRRRPGHLPLQLAPPRVRRPPPGSPGALAGPGGEALVPGAGATHSRFALPSVKATQ